MIEAVAPTTPPQAGEVERVSFERLLANLRGEIELEIVERVAVAIECARTNGAQDWHRVNSMTLARAAIAALATPSQRDGGGE